MAKINDLKVTEGAVCGKVRMATTTYYDTVQRLMEEFNAMAAALPAASWWWTKRTGPGGVGYALLTDAPFEMWREVMLGR